MIHYNLIWRSAGTYDAQRKGGPKNDGWNWDAWAVGSHALPLIRSYDGSGYTSPGLGQGLPAEDWAACLGLKPEELMSMDAVERKGPEAMCKQMEVAFLGRVPLDSRVV